MTFNVIIYSEKVFVSFQTFSLNLTYIPECYRVKDNKC